MGRKGSKTFGVWLGVLVFLFFTVLGGSQGFAQLGSDEIIFKARRNPAQRAPRTILDYKDKLKLTNEQVEKIKAYLFDLERREGSLRRELARVNREVLALLAKGAEKQGSLNLDEVRKKVDRSFQIRADMVMAEIETAEKINRLLTPAQFKQWREINSKRRLIK